VEYPVLALESGKPRRSSGQAAIVQAVDVGVVWIRAHLAHSRSSTNPLTGFAWTLNHQEAFSSIDEFEPRFAGCTGTENPKCKGRIAMLGGTLKT